jgi:nucleotide-binding universal stress UspA family protein
MKNILVALDGSGAATRALKEAIALAKANGAGIRLVHAHEEPLIYGEIAVYVPREKMAELQRRHSEDILRPAEAELKAAGVKCTAEVLAGPIGQTIAAHAERQGCDLIVMGRHGRSTVSDVLVGSVAMKVLHATRLPVLLVR